MKQNTGLREFVIWLMERQDIRICTVQIKFFKPGVSDNDPIVKHKRPKKRRDGKNPYHVAVKIKSKKIRSDR